MFCFKIHNVEFRHVQWFNQIKWIKSLHCFYLFSLSKAATIWTINKDSINEIPNKKKQNLSIACDTFSHVTSSHSSIHSSPLSSSVLFLSDVCFWKLFGSAFESKTDATSGEYPIGEIPLLWLKIACFLLSFIDGNFRQRINLAKVARYPGTALVLW